MLQDQLMPILQFWLQKAEDCTGLPMLLQGQQGLGQLGVVGLRILQSANHGVEMPSQHLRLGDAMGGQTHFQLALGDLLQPAE